MESKKPPEAIDYYEKKAELQKKKEVIHSENKKVGLFREITNEMAELYSKKNADYGDSFGDSFREFGMTSPVIRLGDKYRRLKSLMYKNAEVKDESIEDTLMDMANYAIMTIIELRNP